MSNIFFEDNRREFKWNHLGDIRIGRGGLCEEMPVLLYRLMQFTLVDVISSNFGLEKCNDILRDAGFLAGTEFAKNALDTSLEFNPFVAHLQEQLKLLKVGILRIEHFDNTTGEIIMTVEEDLDCSGLPITGEVVCAYDEGFLAGVLLVYTNKKYDVREIDCWATGGRICRFEAKPVE